WNHGGDLIADGLFGNWFVQWKNYWYNYGWGGYDNPVMDDRKTRGDVVAKRPGSWDAGIGWGSDSRKKFSFETNVERYSVDDGGYANSMWINLNYRPSSNIRLSLTPSFNRSHSATQYVGTVNKPIFSAIEQ